MKELFLIILKQAVNASWIILAVLLARALTRRSAKWTRNLLWALVAVRLIVPFALESPISLVPTLQQQTQQTVAAAPSTQDQPISDAVTVQVPDRVTGQQDAQPSGAQQSAAPVQQDAPAPSAQVVAGQVAQDVQQGARSVQWGALSALDIAGAVWMLGVVLMLLYNIVCHLRLRRRVKDAMLSSDGVWETEWLGAPMVIGYLRPRVYLPRGIDPAIREHIIAHERAHIRRGDHLSKMFAYLLLAVFWFHPLVWVAYYLFCRDVELACDERVIRGLDDEGVRAYARALLSYGSADRTTAAAAQPAFAQTSVKTRLQNIVNYKKPTVWVIALTIAVCVVTAVCFLTVQKPVNVSAIEPDTVGATDAPVAPVTQPSTEQMTEPVPTSVPEPAVEPEPVTDPVPVDEPTVDPEPVDEPEPEPIVEPEPEPVPEPKTISFVPRTTPLEGEKIELPKNSSSFYFRHRSESWPKFGSHIQMPVYNQNGDNILSDLERITSLSYETAFELIFNENQLQSVASELNIKYFTILDDQFFMQSMVEKYDETFFKDNVLFLVVYPEAYDRPFTTTKLDSVVQNGNELSVNFSTGIRDFGFVDAETEYRCVLFEMPYNTLNSLDTISFYIHGIVYK